MTDLETSTVMVSQIEMHRNSNDYLWYLLAVTDP